MCSTRHQTKAKIKVKPNCYPRFIHRTADLQQCRLVAEVVEVSGSLRRSKCVCSAPFWQMIWEMNLKLGWDCDSWLRRHHLINFFLCWKVFFISFVLFGLIFFLSVCSEVKSSAGLCFSNSDSNTIFQPKKFNFLQLSDRLGSSNSAPTPIPIQTACQINCVS